MPKINDKVSIITVTYNCAEVVESTILSVLNQTYPNIEYIIVDGGSTDGTVDVIKKYENRLNQWISEPDNGVYDAMNKGTDLAGGDWINFMNAGDCFHDNNVIQNVFSVNNNADLVCGETLIVNSEFAFIFKRYPIDLIWKKTPFIHQAVFINLKLMKEYRYDLTYKIGADHDFFYRAFRAGKIFSYLDLVVCRFDGQAGMTKSNIVLAIKDKMNIALKYDYSVWKKIYYHLYLSYIYLNQTIKALIGNHFTMRIRRLIKKLKND